MFGTILKQKNYKKITKKLKKFHVHLYKVLKYLVLFITLFGGAILS